MDFNCTAVMPKKMQIAFKFESWMGRSLMHGSEQAGEDRLGDRLSYSKLKSKGSCPPAARQLDESFCEVLLPSSGAFVGGLAITPCKRAGFDAAGFDLNGMGFRAVEL
ncbi:MAG TPA: hypothetical protein VM095_13670 [Pyrinomonadaceae bacterium]|nr:hypothetical protein [Pyrinomonadaceae bacterium]